MTGVSGAMEAPRDIFDTAVFDGFVVTFSTFEAGFEDVGPDCAQALLAMSRTETVVRRMNRAPE
jgi:hypothetical protein